MKTIKKISVLALTPLVFLGACNIATEEEVSRLEQENAQMIEMIQMKDSVLQSYSLAMQDVENAVYGVLDNANAIRISLEDNGEGAGFRETVLNEINEIKYRIIQKQEKIAELKEKLDKAESGKKELRNIIASLNKELAFSEQKLNNLKQKLNESKDHEKMLIASLDKLSLVNKNLSDELGRLNENMKKAYYASGDWETLKEKGIVEKNGGFFNMIARTKTINPDVEKSLFTEIDITKTSSIPLEGKNPKLLSKHPRDSYAFHNSGSEKKLVIINPEKFWQVTSYLVVQTN
jgi:uncharacterized phage infection (PIP) family protein YhgE